MKETKYDITMPFYEIRLSLIGACNQKCFYCGPFTDGKYNKGYERMPITRIEELAARLGGVIKKNNIHIQLTGGEPMLRKDLPEIVNVLRKFKIKNIGITTNGSLLNPRIGLKLAEKGISDFHIHFPSLDSNIYSKTAGVAISQRKILDIINSVKAIKRHGARVEFNTPVTEINFPAINKLLDFCYDNKINLKLIEELSFGKPKVKFNDIKKIFLNWFRDRKLNVPESAIKNRYGIIYQFDSDFFFRIAPVSPEFQSNIISTKKRPLLDGRYWIGSHGGEFLYTSSYFLNPIGGDINDLEEQLKLTIREYNTFFNNSKNEK